MMPFKDMVTEIPDDWKHLKTSSGEEPRPIGTIIFEAFPDSPCSGTSAFIRAWRIVGYSLCEIGARKSVGENIIWVGDDIQVNKIVNGDITTWTGEHPATSEEAWRRYWEPIIKNPTHSLCKAVMDTIKEDNNGS